MNGFRSSELIQAGVFFVALLVVLLRPGCALQHGKAAQVADDHNDAPIIGIDVSHYQGRVDWRASAGTGISFAYIKASEGTHIKDPYFDRNADMTREANVVSGAYHFFDPRFSGIDQANHFLQVLQGKTFQLPPVIDIEVTRGVARALVVKRFNEMVAVVKERTGCEPMIYSDVSFYKKYILNELSGKNLWLARYGVKTPPAVEGNKVVMWQKSDRGRVRFVKTAVDLNEYLGDHIEFDKLSCNA